MSHLATAKQGKPLRLRFSDQQRLLPRWMIRLLVLCLMSCNLQRTTAQELPNDEGGYTYSFPAMGSTFEIAAYTDNVDALSKAVQAIESEVLRLNDLFTDYDANSELERLLASPEPERFELSKDLFAVLQASEDWYRKTNGVFDPSVGKLTHLWRKRRRAGKLPTEQEVALAKEHSGWNLIKLDSQEQRVTFLDPEVEIDLGGIATGYTVDRCFEMLQQANITCCLINSGGDIRCGQAPPNREGWKIEVAPIEKDKEPLHYLTVRNCAITTSGDLWRFTDVNGVRRSHIIDPKTGYGIPGPTAVTVISTTCLEVDVLGTTLSILGPEKGLEYLAKSFPHAHALFAWKPQNSDVIEQVSTPEFKTAGLN